MTNKQDAAREARIADERKRLRVRPWEFAPSQVFGRANPYMPDVVGHASWIKAQAQCEEIIKNSPNYFNEGPKG